MSLLITLRLPGEEADAAAIPAARKLLGSKGDNLSYALWKKTFDLRRGRFIKNMTVKVDGLPFKAEARFGQKEGMRQLSLPSPIIPTGQQKLTGSPVIIGFGPAGLFAALSLALQGYRPIVLERGSSMEIRDQQVAAFFEGGALNTQCNIQFGEGGAGAYSDGKLTTRIDDPRCALITQWLVEHGAPQEAFIAAKPHIGTDLLKPIVVSIRRKIEALGGRVCFDTAVTGLICEGERLQGVMTDQGEIACTIAIAAIGHSARDTFDLFARSGIVMEPKAFSAGVRIEHLQRDIDDALYGSLSGSPLLPQGEYALTTRAGNRGCYTFCMCPGGQVVAAASEEEMQVVNGMSCHARDGVNANAALCVTVDPSDYGGGLLDGVAFQRALERRAFEMAGGGYRAPVQRVEDFIAGQASTAFGAIKPSYPRETAFCHLGEILPPFISNALAQALGDFGKKLPGFDHPDALLTGVETRTSSPIRIIRGEDGHSPRLRGFLPCGEGAGYAGGIMSAAVDGLRCAEAVMKEWLPMQS